WVEKLSRNREIASGIQAGTVKFLHVDLGPTGDWGYPTDISTAAKWPEYSLSAWRTLNAHSIDTVLIDGRFRVACALNAIFRCRQDTDKENHDSCDDITYHFDLTIQ